MKFDNREKILSFVQAAFGAAQPVINVDVKAVFAGALSFLT